MKKILLLFALAFTLICKAQPDDMLFYYTWQLSQINIEGQTNIPNNSELNHSNVILYFYETTPYTFSLQVCQTTLSGEIEYPFLNTMVFPNELDISGDPCELSENNDFKTLLFSFFQNNLNISLDYQIGIVDFDPPTYYPFIVAPNGDWVEFHETYLNVESFNKKMFFVYPNPVSDRINIRNLNSQNISKMRLLTLQGSVLMKTENNYLNTAQLPTGMYLLEIIAENGAKQIEKIIKK